MRIIYKIQC